jgi:hypothetical protein
MELTGRQRDCDLTWGNLRYVREIRFDSCEPITIGTLTRAAWKD